MIMLYTTQSMVVASRGGARSCFVGGFWLEEDLKMEGCCVVSAMSMILVVTAMFEVSFSRYRGSCLGSC